MVVLGIDVGKRELFVNLQDGGGTSPPQILGQRGPVANTVVGLQQLSAWALKHVDDPVNLLVVMEATNVYWERSAQYFHALGCQISVVNPAQIKYFARSVLRRGKTDAMDAEIIARYGCMMGPTPWVPPRTVLIELKQLTREREGLLVRRTQENNHLIALNDAHHASPVVVDLTQRRITLLDEQVVLLEAAMRTIVEEDGELRQQLQLLLSVPGFAFTSAVTVLAETVGFRQLETGEEISAAAGMAPSPQQSGLRQGKGSISKTGNARLRRIAYLAALGASKSHSRMKIYYQGLKARGKPPKVALIALGRKLLVTGLAVVKSGKPYQDDFSLVQDGSGPTPHAATPGS